MKAEKEIIITNQRRLNAILAMIAAGGSFIHLWRTQLSDGTDYFMRIPHIKAEIALAILKHDFEELNNARKK